ncbi:PIN domain-containing protein [Micromonospora sicca]|uniref:PIN domain-containing protein n=1 Tax=Micromonospora sicca TaxID=2202420 RepID=UPI00137505C4|nr:PIN domain-containing protein [Micromonospora sp. 4G51]
MRCFGAEYVHLVVLDTNVYLHHERKLEDLNLADELGLGIATIRLVVPMVIVNELVKAKLTGGDKSYRAGYSVAYIDRVVQAGGQLCAADYDANPPHGEVRVNVLLDPMGHVRLPINDDEIVDRAVALAAFSGRPVRLVTFDTGMAMRARAANLKVYKLDQPPPPPKRQPGGGQAPTARAKTRG